MDDNQLTPFDNMTQTRGLQMLKAAVPYMKGNRKRQMAILIKYMELQNTASVFAQEDKVLSMCSVDEKDNNTLSMLNEIRRFCNEREQEMIDTYINVMTVMETYGTVFG